MLKVESFTEVQSVIFANRLSNLQAPALISPNQEISTYGDICSDALRVARAIRDTGAGGSSQVVAMHHPPGHDAVAAMVGILAAGATYLPINANTPSARIAEILSLSGANMIMTPDECALSGVALPCLYPGYWKALQPLPTQELPPIHPEQPAYAIYTSGSAGRPKGVVMPHRGLSRLIEWQCCDSHAAPRTLLYAPFGFDVSLQEILSTLAAGGSLVLCDAVQRSDPAKVLNLLISQSVERLFITPSALHQVAREAARLQCYPAALQQVICAGEALVVTSAIKSLFMQLPHARLDNQYGPTEAHLVTRYRCEGTSGGWEEKPPIGKAVAGSIVRILDRALTPLHPGGQGELYVGGIGVAHGYLADPCKTAQSFLPDPYARQPGAIMYRTGDRAVRDEDGILHYFGRSDGQIKVRGYRVEPGEVEAALCSLPFISEAVAALRDMADGVAILVAYVVPNGQLPVHREISRHLAELLPDYMIPLRFVALSHLPRTQSNKVDRLALKALPLPPEAAAEGAETGTDTDMQGTVRRIWQRVLGHQDFDDDEDFFDVGGDSLLAVWVVNELTRATGREVPLSLFLECGSVDLIAEALADCDGRSQVTDSISELISLRQGPPERLVFLLHPLGGEVLAYRGFARAILSRVRLVGVQLRADCSGEALSIEELAEAHAQEILALEPAGPFRLAGWSFGGTLAFEVARRLVERGHSVSFLGMIDANPAIDPLSGRANAQTHYLDRIDASLAAIGSGEMQPGTVAAAGNVLEELGVFLPPGMHASDALRYLSITRANLAGIQRYTPSSFAGSITLFQAARTPEDIQSDLAESLKHLAQGPLFVRLIEGDHFSILRQPDVVGLASAFDAAITNALAEEEVS